MTLLRAASRTLLASYFVVSGVKAVKNPQPFVAAAEPLTERLVPAVKRYLPEQAANAIPEDAASLVRLNGALQLLGGVALASGKGRRVGSLLLAASLIPSTLARHPFWTRTSEEERALDKSHFLKNASLLGGVLIAARDTEGRPSLAYRAHTSGQLLAKDTRKAGHKVAKETRAISDAALAEGAMLVGAAVATTRKAKKKAAKELKRSNKKFGAKQLKQGRATARRAAAEAQSVAARAAKEAKVSAAAAAKEAQKQAKKLNKSARKVAKNIHLGEN
ncbi:MAG TPA: DoxX family membrane protein [Propionibacteriaceae bacterium]|nr:DoxX family membrane protein [Propionibacteriaceae bacterium]